MSDRLTFLLPSELEAGQPPEARGLTRDAVRMMVAFRSTGRLIDTSFSAFPEFFEPDDLVVVNTSATLAAALPAVDPDRGRSLVVHLSTQLGPDRWAVEPRRLAGRSSERWPAEELGPPPRSLLLGEDGATMELLEPYLRSSRLWVARLRQPGPVLTWLAVHGQPIRYGYAEGAWPITSYQNVYATEPGSAEMPSAGRPFTPEVVTRLAAKGVGIAPVVLHTGVASLEADEHPYPERVRVPPSTARRVNTTKAAGGRVVAIGTTTVRALESAADGGGTVRALEAWTDLVITPERGVRVVDGLLTGWHEPAASHLLMLEAVAGRSLLEASYQAALAGGYLWHEFGDVHLVLP